MVVAEGAVHQFLMVVAIEPASIEPAAKQHFQGFHVLGVKGNLIQGLAVGARYGGHVFGAFEAAFDFERIYADFFQFGQFRQGA